VGTRVECAVGDRWARGFVCAHFHVEPDWPDYRWVPYQVLQSKPEVPDRNSQTLSPKP
jgi:hypothetical protein